MVLRALGDIITELEGTLGALEAEPVALTGGITNRNYRVRLGGGEYVVRLHGRDTELLGIDRTAELQATRAAAELGIAPRVVASASDCLVTEFIDCTAMTATEVAREIEQIARALRRFHDSALRLPVVFAVPALLERYARLTEKRGRELPPAYEVAQRAAERIERALGSVELCPCHNDLLAGNIIRARGGRGTMIVDWECAGMGDPRFDLGNLAVNNGLDGDAEERLLHAYHGRPARAHESVALALMRVLSDAREGAWGVVQGALSDLDFDFAEYAHEHLGRMLAVAQEPAFEEMLARASR